MSLYSLSVRVNTFLQQIDLLCNATVEIIDFHDIYNIIYNRHPVAEYETEWNETCRTGNNTDYSFYILKKINTCKSTTYDYGGG